MALQRGVHLRPRLECALTLLAGSQTVADIGCDHGRLAVSLVQRGAAKRCIAADISPDSLEKCRALAARTGCTPQVETRLGDGLAVLKAGEADALAILGMGGTLIARLLAAADMPLMGAGRAVLSPMRSAEDLRRWLYLQGYFIRRDCIVQDGGRLYQALLTVPPGGKGRQAIPAGWPEDCFEIGFMSYALGEPLLPRLARQRLEMHRRRLKGAAGTPGEAELRRGAENMETVLALMGERT